MREAPDGEGAGRQVHVDVEERDVVDGEERVELRRPVEPEAGDDPQVLERVQHHVEHGEARPHDVVDEDEEQEEEEPGEGGLRRAVPLRGAAVRLRGEEPLKLGMSHPFPAPSVTV